MVRAVDGLSRRDVEVVQLVGGLSALASALTGQELVRELSERGARHRRLHAPALFGSAEALAMMLQEQAIADALNAAKMADIALVGIGTPGIGSSGTLIDALGLTAQRADFDASGPVGDVCARFYDLSGTEVRSVVSERVLAVTPRRPPRHPHRRGGGRGRRRWPSSAPCAAGSSTSSSATRKACSVLSRGR